MKHYFYEAKEIKDEQNSEKEPDVQFVSSKVAEVVIGVWKVPTIPTYWHPIPAHIHPQRSIAS